MRRRLVTIAAIVAAGTATATAAAHGHGSITEKVLGAAGIAQPYTVAVAEPADVIVAKATVPPGASFGWHSHRAAAVVVVKSGTLTLYDSADPSCTAQRYSAGHGFVEQPDHVHMARNEGHKPVELYVTYLGLEHGVNPDVPATSPGNCRF
jgi:quercetin dioxygenase-like cupin family protein